VHAALALLDPLILTSPDGKRVEVSLAAISEIVANPPIWIMPLEEPSN
jgi:hypothetical protein